MLAALLATTLITATPQQPQPVADAVAVCGEAELSAAEAFASASRKAEDHLRERWEARVERTVAQRRPFWLPECLVAGWGQRWLADLPLSRLARVVDREDKERVHDFGNSYQTTLWVAEDPGFVESGQRNLQAALRRLERTTAIKYGGIVAGWALLALIIGWLDRLSRGYMSGRLRVLGLACGVAFPLVAFLV
ncbi:MAG: hypothetical protein KDC98_12575 [Planctomycetes bacterium]|nr:hypothetical protein [Planctomycetota bacterium]